MDGAPRHLPPRDLPRLVAGLLLAVLWTAGVVELLAPADWLARLALAAAGLPLIALLLGAGGPRIRPLLGLLAPLALLWAVNYQALGSWWLLDDPCNLALVAEQGSWRPFVHSSGSFLNPLLYVSLGLDLSLFGLQPTAFYAHQLLSFSLLLAVASAFLRAYLTPAGSGLALSLFAVTLPVFAIAQLQMNRHYLEGLVLTLASFVLYRRAVESGRCRWAIPGAALYLLATTAKEVFVPLVVLLPFLMTRGTSRGSATEDWRARLFQGLPYGAALGAYGLWRLYMLGWSNSLSGYGTMGGEPRLDAVLRLPALLGFAHPWQQLAAAAAFAAAVLALGRRSKLFLAAAGVGLVVVMAPLIPTAGRLAPRHAFIPCFAVTAILAAALETARPRWRRAWRVLAQALAGTLLLLLALSSLTSAPFWRYFERTLDHLGSEGRFVLDGESGGLLLTTVNHTGFLQCLAQLRQDVLAWPGGPGFCGDPCYCSRAFPGESRWLYSGGQIAAAPDPSAGDCDARRPLEVRMSHDRTARRMSWRFGPYAEGSYEVLLFSSAGGRPGISIPVAIPRQGSMPYWLSRPLRFVLKYRSPEGWQTYSPVFRVEPGGEAAAE